VNGSSLGVGRGGKFVEQVGCCLVFQGPYCMELCMDAKGFDGPLRYEHFVCVLIQFYRQAENSITLG